MRTLFVHNKMHRIARQYDKAQALVDQLTDYTKQKGVYRTALGPHIVQGWIFADMGDFDRAAACFQEAIEFLGEQGLIYEQGRAIYALGRIHNVLRQDLDTAERLIRAAIDVYCDEARHHDPAYIHYFGQSTRTNFTQASYQSVLVDVIAKRGRLQEAFEYEREVLALLQSVDDRGTLYDVYITLSHLSGALRKPYIALYYWLSAVLGHPITFLKHNIHDLSKRLALRRR
jgi:tetratricopeptide (TPR) repeat protein